MPCRSPGCLPPVQGQRPSLDDILRQARTIAAGRTIGKRIMKALILALGFCVVAGAAPAQQPVDGSRYSQERLRPGRTTDSPALRHGSSDARQLYELQRLRQRSEQRVRALRQPSQTSRPANANNSRKNTVVTQ